MKNNAQIAYFSMEIALQSSIPTYAGGLGVLAGDTIRSAADMGLPMDAVTLLAHKGYFHQKLDETGWQTEEPVRWQVDDYLTLLDARTFVEIEGRKVALQVWQYEVKGVSGHVVPVYLLDADLEENSENDRVLTHYLYGGDEYYRLCQEVILGIGGVRMLRALGHDGLFNRYHMNEGHAALLVVELLDELVREQDDKEITQAHFDAIRPHCVFTTHTPVPAGHDKFPLDMVYRVLGRTGPFVHCERAFCPAGELNMTFLALNNSHFVNGVAKRHRQVSQQMFSGFDIDAITNGVHVATWASASMQNLFDRFISGWREDYASLRYAINIPQQDIWNAHVAAKDELIEYCNHHDNIGLDKDVLTLGFARRVTPYKRPVLLFEDVDRLQAITERSGPIQIVYAGKAHPHDQHGKELIQGIYRVQKILRNSVKICYLPEYNMALGKLMTAGADVWINTPQPPMEASGTSGMKAAVNGVPSLSVMDGWWLEGCIEGITGWSFGDGDRLSDPQQQRVMDAHMLYDKLEQQIIPMYYTHPDEFISVMRNAIAINGSFFNTERMLNQYVTKAYFK